MYVPKPVVLGTLLASALLVATSSAAAAGPTINLVSVSSSGEQGNGQSFDADATPDGHYIAFQSYASNLVDGDTNNRRDIFLRDTVAGTTELISANAAGDSGNAGSRYPVISEDGRHIAFMSGATDLVSESTHGFNAYVYDRIDDTMTLASVNNQGVPANDGGGLSVLDMTPDGRHVAFTSQATNLSTKDTSASGDIYVRDLQLGVTRLVSVRLNGKAAGRSNGPSMSSDANVVAFQSASAHIVDGDDNGVVDTYVRVRTAGVSELASVSGSGDLADGASSWQPSLSGSGRFVAFISDATNLAATATTRENVFLHDRVTGATKLVSKYADGSACDSCYGEMMMSLDGSSILFRSDGALLPDDHNVGIDVYLWDRPNAQMYLISQPLTGSQEDLTFNYASGISADGRFVMFNGNADNLVPNDTNPNIDLFVLDRTG